jgi:hypothetical protein
MAKYSDIKGFTVQTVSSDPGATQFAAGSWASAAPAPQTTQSGGSFGTSTAAVSTGGYNGSSYVQTTIEFNGSAWSSGGSMTRPAGQSFPAFGTEPSGGIAGGYKTSGNAVVNNFESYNGTAFTEETDLNSARQMGGATGASATAGIVVGGTTGVLSPPDVTGNNNVEIWNGSSWTEISEINTARYNLKALGSTCPAPTAVVAGGENSGTKTNITEKYDGSSWSESGDMNTARSAHGGAGNVATSGICFGGEGSAPSYTNYALTEHFDGSTWTEVSDLSGTRHSFSTATGTGAAAIAGQGRNPGFTGLTETWSAPSTFQKIIEGQLFFNSTANAFKETIFDIPGATWASGGTKNNPSRNNAAFGTQTATVSAGESGGSASNKTEEYDGTSWTEVNNLPASLASNSGAGVLTSGSSFGGSPTVTEQYLYDGTNWTDGADLNEGRHAAGAAGTSSTSAIMFGGHPPNLTSTEVYDGSSWSEKNDLNYGRQLLCGVGTVTAALAIGGSGSPPLTSPNQSELWDGVTWTSAGSLPVNVYGNAGSGTSTLSIAMGGLPPSTDTSANMRSTQFWNGASWSEVAEMATSRASAQGTGSALAGFVIGGYNPANAPGYDDDANKTEEWTVDLSNKTITAS